MSIAKALRVDRGAVQRDLASIGSTEPISEPERVQRQGGKSYPAKPV